MHRPSSLANLMSKGGEIVELPVISSSTRTEDLLPHQSVKNPLQISGGVLRRRHGDFVASL